MRRRMAAIGLAAIVTAMLVLAAWAAAPAAKAKAHSAKPAAPHTASAGTRPSAADANDPDLDDGIERMDGPDAWEAFGMGPAGLLVPSAGTGRGADPLRRRALAERRLEVMRELDLTPPQRRRIEAIRDRQQRLAIEQQAKLELARLDLRALLRAETLNRAAVEAKADELARLAGQLRRARLTALLDMREVLTPEQQAKLRELHGDAGD